MSYCNEICHLSKKRTALLINGSKNNLLNMASMTSKGNFQVCCCVDYGVLACVHVSMTQDNAYLFVT